MAVSKKVATRNIQTIKIQGHINSFKYQDNDLGTIAITIPRSEIYDTFTENELFHNCLYFLFGNNGNKEVAYVGQAKKRNSNESVLNRIREHDKKEEESYNEKWNNVVIVTNKNDVWTIDDVCALEKAFFIEIGKDNRLNTQTPNYGGDDFERFMTKIEQVKLLITAIGFNMFSKETNVDNVQVVPDYTNFSVEDLHNWGSTIPEVITPKKVVKKMVDLLPNSVWNDKTVFLDPACKGGEYLKEIYDRLMESEYMKTKYPNDIARSTHILKNQLYGIALSKVWHAFISMFFNCHFRIRYFCKCTDK